MDGMGFVGKFSPIQHVRSLTWENVTFTYFVGSAIMLEPTNNNGHAYIKRSNYCQFSELIVDMMVSKLLFPCHNLCGLWANSKQHTRFISFLNIHHSSQWYHEVLSWKTVIRMKTELRTKEDNRNTSSLDWWKQLNKFKRFGFHFFWVFFFCSISKAWKQDNNWI